MNEMDAGSDPEQTRETQIPPPATTSRHTASEGPTRFIPTPPPYRPPSSRPIPRPAPPPPPHRLLPPASPPPRSPVPPPPAPPPAAPTPAPRNTGRPGREQPGEAPWWQTINRDRRPSYPAPPSAQPSPKPPTQPAPPAPAPQASVSPTGKRASVGWWIAAAVGAVLVIAGGGAALAVSGTTPPLKVLDVESAQRQVEQIVRDPLDGYGAGTVTGVVCNDGVNPALEKGAEFLCEAVVDGVSRRVAVVFQDDAGTFAVDRPR